MVKQALYKIIDQKIKYFQELIENLHASNTETKSGMGDKFETGREMLEQEIIQLQRQLANIQDQKVLLNRM